VPTFTAKAAWSHFSKIPHHLFQTEDKLASRDKKKKKNKNNFNDNQQLI
jgi:hypothetical protein